MFGKCKGCEARDSHIGTLKDEISNLRRLCVPTPQLLPSNEAHRAADLLGGNHENPGKEEFSTIPLEEAISLEANLILSGEYDGFN